MTKDSLFNCMFTCAINKVTPSSTSEILLLFVMIMATYTLYLLLAGFVALTLWTVTNAVQSYYRLSHIPGPFLAAFSRLWLLKGH